MRHIIVQSICRGMELGKIEIEATQDETLVGDTLLSPARSFAASQTKKKLGHRWKRSGWVTQHVQEPCNFRMHVNISYLHIQNLHSPSHDINATLFTYYFHAVLA